MPIRSWLRLRLRTLLALIVVIAVVLGGVIEWRRRARRAIEMPYEMRYAARVGDVGKLGRLLAEGADVNALTDGRFPWSPLMHAADTGQLDAARFLIDRGADVDRQDLDYFRPVTLAAREGHWRIVRLLVERKADTTVADGYGRTALEYAREQRQDAMIRLLGARVGREIEEGPDAAAEGSR